jgi:hypothetical protein
MSAECKVAGETVRVTGSGTGLEGDPYRDKVKNGNSLGLGVTGVTG